MVVRTFSVALAALTLGAAAALALVAGASPASAQGRIVDRHGDWQIRCEQPVGSPSEQCALVQNVEAQDRANVGLTVIFLRTADRQARILRVLAPLGVLLPSGLGLSIDDNEVGLAGFVRCLPEGCIAEVELDDGLLERFGAGKTATFVIFQTPEEGIGIPISLNGFTTGFAALDNPPPPASASADEPPAAPPQPVETTVETAQADPARAPAQFIDTGDDRTELDRLLEDPLLPYVAAAAFLVLAIIIVLLIILTRGRRRRRRMRNAQAETVAHEETFETPYEEEDEMAVLEGGAAPAPAAKRDRLAGGRRQRQLPSSGAAERPEGNAPRAPNAPRGPEGPRTPNGPRGPRQR